VQMLEVEEGEEDDNENDIQRTSFYFDKEGDNITALVPYQEPSKLDEAQEMLDDVIEKREMIEKGEFEMLAIEDEQEGVEVDQRNQVELDEKEKDLRK
jgi:hypothetical protein